MGWKTTAFSHQSAAQGGCTRDKQQQEEAQEEAKNAIKRPQRQPKGLPEAVSGALLEEKGMEKLYFAASLVKMLIFRKSMFYLSKSIDFEGSAPPKSESFLRNWVKFAEQCDHRPDFG